MVDGKKKTDSMSRIIIDGRMINESGIGRYLRNLLDNLQKIDKINDYHILLLEKDFNTVVYYGNFHKVLANFKWYTITEQIKLPKILHDLVPDLVHFPHFNVPLLYKGKFVVTIHDLIHQHQAMSTHGKLLFSLKKYGYKKVFSVAVRKSQKILVPSEFVRHQLLNEWKVEDSKVVVIYEGVNLSHPRGGLALHGIKSPYILYVGNAHPHKNIEGLIIAFLKLKDSSLRQNGDLKLVLAGKSNYFWEGIKKKYDHPKIIYTGFVSDEELASLYKNASVYVEPSFEEGFGLPILEAFAAGCPVVASNIGSLKEVGGDAVLYFDPNDLGDMVEKIYMVLKSENLSKELIEKGRKRVKLFSWKKMAEQTMEVYQRCV